MNKQSLIYTDDLTGVNNRRYLNKLDGTTLKALRKQNIPYTIAIADIDHFKSINDNYGHLKGDQVIREFARFIQDNLRKGDVLIRYGGDEFIAILLETGKRDARIVWSRTMDKLRHTKIGGLAITISLGISSYPQDGNSLKSLIEKADKSLYIAKKSGRDRIGDQFEKRIQIPIRPFIDREEIYNQIKTNIDSGGLTLIKGAVGIGKTRLAREVISTLKRREVVWSDCLPFMESIPYYPIRELIKYRMKRKGKKLLNKIPAAYRIELSKLVPEAGEEISPEIRNSIGEVLDRYRLYEGVRIAFEIGEARKIIVIDNVQWIDTYSLEVFKYMIRAFKDRGFTYIFLSREEESNPQVESFLQDIGRYTNINEYSLPPFEYSYIKESINAILGGYALPSLAHYIQQESGGNPLYIEEIARELYQKRNLHISDGAWIFDVPKNGIVPRSIEDITNRKYQSLSEEAKEVLKISSVVGSINTELLRHLLNYNEGHIIGLLDKIEKTGLLHETENAVVFKENITRNVIYNKYISPIRRRLLHRKVADFIELKNTKKITAFVEELAYHYYRAREYEKGIKYCVMAGKVTKEKYANKNALKYYQWAMQLIENKKDSQNAHYTVQCLMGRIDVFMLTGQNEEALKDAEEGIRLAKNLQDQEMEADFLSRLAYIHNSISKYREAIEYAQKSLSIYEKTENLKGEANALNIIAVSYMYLSEYEKSFNYLKKARDAYEKSNNKSGIAGVLNNIGIIHNRMGNYEESLKLYNESLQITREINDKRVQDSVLSNIGALYLDAGDYKKALLYSNESINVAEEIGDASALCASLIISGLIYKTTGKLAEALELYNRARDICEMVEEKSLYLWSIESIGEIHFIKGDMKKALAIYREVREKVKDIQENYLAFVNLLDTAELYLDLDNAEEAQKFLEGAKSMAEQTGSTGMLKEVLLNLFEYNMLVWNMENAENLLVKLKDMETSLRSKSFEGDLRLAEGRLSMEKGEYDTAAGYITKSINVFSQLGQNFDLGKSYYYMGKLYEKMNKPIDAKANFKKSLKIFDTIGAVYWHKKLIEVLYTYENKK